MRVAITTGIFPPDIGGPATHAADLVDELKERGHAPIVLSLTDAVRRHKTPALVRYPRRWPWPVRAAAVVWWLVRNRSRYDVVYSTGLGPMAVVGARLARRPIVLKQVGDPAWERGSRHGLTGHDFDTFQTATSLPPRLRAMRAVRNWSVRHATTVIAPSDYLKEVVEGWVDGDATVEVIPNGVRAPALTGRAGAGSDERALRAVFVGRLVAHKNVGLLLEAIARTDNVVLEVLGDGPEFHTLQAAAARLGIAERVLFAGAVSHETVMSRLAESDVLLSASGYEGLPHVVIESLVCGTPVFTAGAGGSTEAVRDGVDGLVLDPTVAAFADALARLRDDPALQRRLSDGARQSGSEWRFDRCADRIESLLERVVAGRPRVVFVGRTIIPPHPTATQRVKFALHARYLRQVSINVGPPGLRTIEGVRVVSFPSLRRAGIGGAVFYSVAPFVALAMTVGRRSKAIVCQSPFEAFGIVLLTRPLPRRLRPRLQIEVHGDWRTAPRMYGSPRRRLIGPLTDRICAWTVRRADVMRVISDGTTEMVRDAGYRGPLDRYITFSDYRAFTEPPSVAPPDEPRVAFVGVFERYKALDVLLDAWAEVVARVPDARLTIVGKGRQAGALHERAESEGLAGSLTFVESMSQTELRGLFDASTCLVLPSRSEGLPRVIMEVMARARPVVASAVGSIPELVEDGVTGYLAPPEDVAALVDALVDVLTHPARARAMGDEARRRLLTRSPQLDYEAGIARLAHWVARSDPQSTGSGPSF